MFNRKVFVALFIAIPVSVLAQGGPAGGGTTEITEVIPNYGDSELTIMGSSLSDGSATPSVELGGKVLNVTSFDANSIVADANLNSFVAGDYLLRVDPNFKKGKSVQTLLTLGSDTVLSESEVDAFVSNNGYSKVMVFENPDTTLSGFIVGCIAASSFTIVFPESGKVVLQVQAATSAGYLDGTMQLAIKTTPGDCSYGPSTALHEGGFVATVSLTKVLTVSNPGPQTFHLNAIKWGGIADGSGQVQRAHWVATFYY